MHARTHRRTHEAAFNLRYFLFKLHEDITLRKYQDFLGSSNKNTWTPASQTRLQTQYICRRPSLSEVQYWNLEELLQ